MQAILVLLPEKGRLILIVVTKPAGGEIWAAGSTHTIEWQSAAIAGTVDVSYSTNGGQGWTAIEEGTANDGVCSWVLPGADANECIVAVLAAEGHDYIEYEYSGVFSIRSSAAGPAVESDWPTLGGGFERTGLSQYSGPELGCVKWRAGTGAGVYSPIVLGAEGRIHAVSADGQLSTFDTEGNLVWTGDVGGGCGAMANWLFDETTGDTAFDSAGNHDGVLTNFVTDDSQWGGGALEFDGVDDYVIVPGYKGVTGGNARTCSAWIKTDKADAEIISWGNTDTGGKWLVRVDATGALRVSVSGGYIIGTTDLTDNQWHKVMVVLADDGSTDIAEAKLYVDGIRERFSVRYGCTVDTGDDNDVKIGIFSTEGTKYFEGLMDDVRVNDCALDFGELGDFVVGHPTVGPDGTIYAGYNDNLYAVDKDGLVRWTHRGDGFIYSGPAVDDAGRVFFGSQDGKVYAIGPDGSELWEYAVPGPGAISNAVLTSPAVGDGTVYVGGLYTSKLYALEAGTGEVLWECDFEHLEDPGNPESELVRGGMFVAPVVGDDGTVYVSLIYDTNLYAVNPADGSIIWSTDMVEALDGLYPSELIDWFAGGDGWSEPVLGPDGTIYVSFDDPFIRAVNPDGSVKWVTQIGMFGAFTLSCGADGLLYACTDEGSMYVLSDTGELVSVFDGVGGLSYPVAGAEGLVYVSDSAGAVLAISVESCNGEGLDLARPGDYDRNGRVNLEDLAVLSSAWGLCTADYRLYEDVCLGDVTYLEADADRSQYVDMGDLVIMALWWLDEF
jgi:outer membrane protein assembly factor BamB